MLGEWRRLKDEETDLLKRACPTKKFVSRFREYRTSFLRRMWNSSEFMRTFKQHFTMSFNARRDHHGTMFEGRYHERNHKPEKPVMWRTAAYVDINAWSAGIVKKAEDYAEIPNGADGSPFVASARSIWNVDLAVFRSRHHLQKKLRAPHVPAESPDAA